MHDGGETKRRDGRESHKEEEMRSVSGTFLVEGAAEIDIGVHVVGVLRQRRPERCNRVIEAALHIG